jgi:hypothetical protein
MVSRMGEDGTAHVRQTTARVGRHEDLAVAK